MARRAKKPNDKHAPSLARHTLNILQWVLAGVGKPFYFTLLFSVIAFLYISYAIGFTLTYSGKLVLKKLKKALLPRKRKKVLKDLPFIPLRLFLLKSVLLFISLTRPKTRDIREFNLSFTSRILLTFSIIFLVFGLVFWQTVLKGLPSAKDLRGKDPEVSTKIYDRNGALLYKIYKDQNRTPVTLDKIPMHVRFATLAIEDAEFYTHAGFSLRGILRALVKNIQGEDLSGGSTITQQLVKNVLLSPEKTMARKIKELILSVEVELTYSKDEILEMYLNEVSYGGTAYGIEEASQVYFEKDVNDLTLGEAALLAGLPKSPSKYSPFSDPEAAVGRGKEVLHLMEVNKFITPEMAKEAKKETIKFAQNKTNIKAPHFVMYVKSLLAEKYGEEVLEKGGLEVTTTLDLGIQQMAEKVLKEEVDKLKNLRVGNGAAVVLNPQTGEILAMVGSRDYFDLEHDGNVNVVLRERQPGSSIKVVNYAYALSNGYTPATIIDDSPVTYKIAGTEAYTPKNYDGKYRGKISLRSALAESRNITAVKTLASFGVGKMIEMGQKMGITTWNNPSRYGLSLTLGGGEVKLLELAKVYSVIANGGKSPGTQALLRVKNYKGKVLEANRCITNDFSLMSTVYAAETPSSGCQQEQVLDAGVAYLLIDILKDNRARSPAFGSNSQLVIPKHDEVAVKTGTSNDLRDNLTVGFNQDYLVAVWVGNNDNSPMSKIASGVTGAAPIWNRIMTSLVADKPTIAWTIPNSVSKLSVCTLTGSLPCDGCPTRQEFFLKTNAPQRACSVEAIEKIKKDNEEKNKQKAQVEGRGTLIGPGLSFP